MGSPGSISASFLLFYFGYKYLSYKEPFSTPTPQQDSFKNPPQDDHPNIYQALMYKGEMAGRLPSRLQMPVKHLQCPSILRPATLSAFPPVCPESTELVALGPFYRQARHLQGPADGIVPADTFPPDTLSPGLSA